MKEAEEVKVSDVPKDKQKIFKINRGKAREKGGPLTKAEKGGKPREEMFAMDIPELERLEKQVDLLVDMCGKPHGKKKKKIKEEDNALKNEPSDEPEEELSRTHDDIAGYGDPKDKEKEYPPGGQDDSGLEDEPEEDLYGHGGMGIGEQLEYILKEENYKEFFKSMMDKEGISSLKGVSDEKKKAFFNKVDKGWKAKGEKPENIKEYILKEHPYNDFFKSMMDKEGLSGLKGQSKEKISSFFKKVSAEWKKKKQ
jgi:hypothetical protein